MVPDYIDKINTLMAIIDMIYNCETPKDNNDPVRRRTNPVIDDHTPSETMRI